MKYSKMCMCLISILRYDFGVALNVILYFIRKLKKRIQFLCFFVACMTFYKVIQREQYNAKLWHRFCKTHSRSNSKSVFSFTYYDALSHLGCSGSHIFLQGNSRAKGCSLCD